MMPSIKICTLGNYSNLTFVFSSRLSTDMNILTNIDNRYTHILTLWTIIYMIPKFKKKKILLSVNKDNKLISTFSG